MQIHTQGNINPKPYTQGTITETNAWDVSLLVQLEMCLWSAVAQP
jgi:hypothetical protein